MQQNTYSDIIEQYRYLLEENSYIAKTYLIDTLKSKIVFSDNKQMREIFKNEVKKYLQSSKNELKIYNFLLKNEKKLYTEDIYGVLNNLFDSFQSRYEYMEGLFENFETAISMQLEYKFYLPKNKPKYIELDDVEKYKTYAKGFNLERIYDFLAIEEVCEEDFIDKNDIKILDVDPLTNINMFGVFLNGKAIIPKVKDELSTLISIHEFIHYVLLKRQNELKDNNIIFQEDLSDFYELLFQKTNNFSKIKIHTTDIALKLLESYDEEPFNDQIEKVKRLYLNLNE